MNLSPVGGAERMWQQQGESLANYHDGSIRIDVKNCGKWRFDGDGRLNGEGMPLMIATNGVNRSISYKGFASFLLNFSLLFLWRLV